MVSPLSSSITVTVTSSSSSVDGNQSVTFRSTETGGSGIYTGYSWSGLPSGCTTVNAASFTCTPNGNDLGSNSKKVYSITLTVTDSLSNTGTSPPLSFTEYKDVSLTGFQGSRSLADGAQVITFNVTSHSGTGTYTYYWASMPAGCSNTTTTSPSVLCDPNNPAVAGPVYYNVSVTVNDTNKYSVISGLFEVKIYQDPTSATPVANYTRSSDSDIGQPVIFNATKTPGGYGTDTWTWSGLPTGCTTHNYYQLNCTSGGQGAPTTAGMFYCVKVSIQDSNGYAAASGCLTYRIWPDPSLGTPTRSRATVDANQTVDFNVSISNSGAGPLTTAWSGLPNPCTSSLLPSGSTISAVCVPSPSDNNTVYTPTAKYTDINGYTVTSAAAPSVSVYGDPTTSARPSGSPASGLVDVGQPVTFSVIIHYGGYGGVLADTVTWSGLPTGCTSSNASTLSACNLTASGTFTITVSVRDRDGFLDTSYALSFTVDADVTVGTPTAGPVTIDDNQSTTFSTVVASGSGGYVYTWYNLPTGCASSNTASLSCSPTVKESITTTFSVNVSAKDSNGDLVNSAHMTFTMYADPQVGNATSNTLAKHYNRNSVDVGQPVDFSLLMNGKRGVAPYTYTWVGEPPGCGTPIGAYDNCTAAQDGYFYINVTIEDADHYTVTNASYYQFMVYNDPLVVLPSANKPSTDVNQAVIFTTSTALGAGNNASQPYKWNNLPTGCVTSSVTSLSCTPTGAGTVSITVTYNDSNGFKVTSSALRFTVYAVPVIGAISLSRTTSDVYQPVTFSDTQTGYGSGGDIYTWLGLPTGCGTQNTLSLSCQPQAAGTFTVVLYVNDSNSGSASATAGSALTVSLDPTLTPLIANTTYTASTTSVDVNQNVTFSSTEAHGIATYTYSWSGLPTGCTASATSTTSCIGSNKPTTAQGYTVVLSVTDGNSFSISTHLSFTVYADPHLSAITASISVRSPTQTVDVGQQLTLKTTLTGGSGGGSYSWSNLPTGCASIDMNNELCYPSATGTFSTIFVTYTDSDNNATHTADITVTVYQDPNASNPYSNRTSSDINQQVHFTGFTAYGPNSATDAITWSGLPTGCASANNTVINCDATHQGIPTSAGVFLIHFTVTDPNGYVVNSPTKIYQIYNDPTASALSISPTTVDIGQLSTMKVTPSGGAGGYSYSWTGLPSSGCSNVNSPVESCIPGTGTAQGTTPYRINVTVIDINGYKVVTSTSSFFVFSDIASLAAPTGSPVSGGIDVNQKVVFTSASPTGGNGTGSGFGGVYTYIWEGLPTGSCTPSGGGATMTCTTTVSGTYAVYVEVEDSSQYKVYGSILDYTVDTDPQSITPVAAPKSADIGQSVSLYSADFLGSGTFNTIRWYGVNAVCSGFTDGTNAGRSVVCTITAAATTHINVTAIDSNGYWVNSSKLTFTSYSKDTAGTITATPSTGRDVGRTVTFSVSPTGGSGGYTYQWSNLPSGCFSLTATVNCDPVAPGSFTVSVTVIDTNNNVTTSTLGSPYVISADPSLAQPYASVYTADVNQAVTFTTITVSQGSGTDVYYWTGLPTGCPTAAGTLNSLTVTCSSVTATGTFTVVAYINDSNHYNSSSQALVYVVHSDPSFPTALTAASVQGGNVQGVDVNEKVTFSTSVTGGYGTYRYYWSNLPSGCGTVNSYTLSCYPSAAGTSVPQVQVTDANFYSVTEAVSYSAFHIYADAVIAQPHPLKNPDVGQIVDIGSSVTSGGNGTFTFTWNNLPAGCGAPTLNATSTDVSCTLTTVQSVSITLTMVDSDQYSVTSPVLPFTVYSDPSLSAVSASPTTVRVFQAVVFSVTESGGSGGNVYVWNHLPSGCSSSNTYRLYCVPITAGTYYVNATVNDSNNVEYNTGAHTGWFKFVVTAAAFTYMHASSTSAILHMSGGAGSPESVTHVVVTFMPMAMFPLGSRKKRKLKTETPEE